MIKPHLPPSILKDLPPIDQEHQVLAETLDLLILSIHANPLSDHTREILARISGHLIDHFESEEKLIKSLGMPGDEVAKHADAHIAIIEQITRLSLDLMKGKTFDRDVLIATVKRWIVDHLLEHDLKI